MADPPLQRLERDPDDAEALEALWQQHAARAQWEPLATLAEKIAARRKNPASAAALWLRAGRLWDDELRRYDKASVAMQRALQVQPKHFEAAQALAELHLRRSRYAEAARAYQAQYAAAADDNQRASVLEDLLPLYEEHLEDPPTRTKVLRALVKLRPRRADLRKQLAAILVPAVRAGTATDEERREAARVVAWMGEDEKGPARLTLAEEALDLWPGDDAAYSLFESESANHRPTRALIDRQIEFLTVAPDAPRAPAVRRKVAAHYTREGQLDHAIEALRPLAATDPSARETLEDLYRRTNRHGDLADLLGDVPSVAQTSAPVGDLASLRARAELYRKAGDQPALLRVCAEILAVEPRDASAFAELEQDARARGAHAELRGVLMQTARVATLPADVRATRAWQAAYLAEQFLGDPAGAVEAWTLVRTIDPTHAEAHAALERLYTRLERWDELVDALAEAARVAPDAASRRTRWLRWAEVHRWRRDDPKAESAALTPVWRENPDDEAVTLWLVDARRRANDAPGTEEVLRAWVARATPEQSVARSTQLATFLESQARGAEAYAIWQQVRAADAGNAMAWDAEERWLEREHGPSKALLELLLAHARHPVAAGQNAGAIYLRAARVADGLGDGATAVTCAEWAQHFLPDDADLLELLERLYTASAATEKLEAVRARIAKAPPRRIAAPAVVAVFEPAPLAEPAPVEPEPDAPRVAPARIAPPVWIATEDRPAPPTPAAVPEAPASSAVPVLPPMIKAPPRVTDEGE